MGAEDADSAQSKGSWRDPVVEAYKAGLDRSLPRENLRRSPAERLENLCFLQVLAEEVRRAGARRRGTPR